MNYHMNITLTNLKQLVLVEHLVVALNYMIYPLVEKRECFIDIQES